MQVSFPPRKSATPDLDLQSRTPRGRRLARAIKRWRSAGIALLAELDLDVASMAAVRALAQRMLDVVAEDEGPGES
jgi:predicted lysophospholipase L1 biosynthesis ABC-type transport system permease subunit